MNGEPADELLRQFSEKLKRYASKENIGVDDCDEFMDDVGKFGIAITAMLKEMGYDNNRIHEFKSEHLDDLLKSSDVNYDKIVNDPRFGDLFFGKKAIKSNNKFLTGLTTLVLGSSLLTNVILYQQRDQYLGSSSQAYSPTITNTKYLTLDPFGSKKLYDCVYRISGEQIKRRPFVTEGKWEKQVNDYAAFLFGKPTEDDLKIIDEILRNQVNNQLKREHSEATLEETISGYDNETVAVNYNFDLKSDWTTHEKYIEVYRAKEKLKAYLNDKGKLKLRGHWRNAAWKLSLKLYGDYHLSEDKRVEVSDLLMRELYGGKVQGDIQMEPINTPFRKGFIITYEGGKK